MRLPQDGFVGLNGLEALLLDGNPLHTSEGYAFRHTALQVIDLASFSLTEINTLAFADLGGAVPASLLLGYNAAHLPISYAFNGTRLATLNMSGASDMRSFSASVLDGVLELGVLDLSRVGLQSVDLTGLPLAPNKAPPVLRLAHNDLTILTLPAAPATSAPWPLLDISGNPRLSAFEAGPPLGRQSGATVADASALGPIARLIASGTSMSSATLNCTRTSAIEIIAYNMESSHSARRVWDVQALIQTCIRPTQTNGVMAFDAPLLTDVDSVASVVGSQLILGADLIGTTLYPAESCGAVANVDRSGGSPPCVAVPYLPWLVLSNSPVEIEAKPVLAVTT